MKYDVRSEGQEVRLAIEGDIDMHVSPELRKVLRRALELQPRSVIVDLAAVPFIDSSGIATIVDGLRSVRQWSGSLRVENCQDAVRDTFEIAGLTRILGISA